MPAPKGHPNYDTEGKAGRPTMHDERFCDLLADEFLDWWFANPNAIWFYQYFVEVRRISKSQVNRFKNKSKKLEDALKLAHDSQESRIYNAGMSKTYSEGLSKFGLACKHKWTPPDQKVKVTADDNAKTILDKVSGKSANLVTND